MEKKSKRMVVTEAEIEAKKEEVSTLSARYDAVSNFKANTTGGQKKREDELARLQQMMDGLRDDIVKLRDRLEVEAVEFLSGADTEAHEPTPREGLERAS